MLSSEKRVELLNNSIFAIGFEYHLLPTGEAII